MLYLLFAWGLGGAIRLRAWAGREVLEQGVAQVKDWLGPDGFDPQGTADLGPMARSFYEGSRRIGNARIKSELGVTLRYPTYREGLASLIPRET